MTTNPSSREAAYADLVTGLIDARVDVASDRFDAELEAAEASGRLDPATARLLRWWQRESVRAVTEHARTTVPGTLIALERAAAEARDAVNRADAAWTTARGVSGRAGYAAAPPAPSQAAAPPPAPAPTASPAPPVPAAAPAPAPVAYPPTLEPPGYPSDDASAPLSEHPSDVSDTTFPGETAYEPAPDEAPAIVDLTAESIDESTPGATPPAGRRRTLLAGLTVLPRSD